MKTVILCGGFGTRIRDVADNIPKPMIPIGDKPILWHIMKYYSTFEHKDFILCLGYKGNIIRDFFLNYQTNTRDFTIDFSHDKKIEFHNQNEELDWKVTLAETGEKAMTGARINKMQKYLIDDDIFMLTYGDGVSNVNIDELLQFHKKHGKILTVTGVYPPGRFGEIMHNDEGLISEFNEKPQTEGGRISGGYFVCNKKLFKYLKDDENLVFEQEPMKQLVKDKEMMVFIHDGFWQPMDTNREYRLLNDLFENNKSPWITW